MSALLLLIANVLIYWLNEMIGQKTMKSCAAIIVALLLFHGQAKAQELVRIAAVVNDDVISILDVEARVTMALTAAGIPDSAEVRRQLLRPVLRSLIDESLQIQEAVSQGVTISELEMRAAIDSVARQNGVEPNQLDSFLGGMGVPKFALEKQIRAQLAWSRYINQRLRPTISVTEEDVAEELARLEANKGKPEYLISEIDLFVEDATREQEIEETAKKLVEQVRGGSVFGAIAQQFSQGTMAASGGNLGWVQRGQLRQEVDSILESLSVGTVSDPIRSPEGFHIIQLRDKRLVMQEVNGDIEVNLKQALLSLPPTVDPESVETQMSLAEVISETVEGCDDMDRVVSELSSTLSGEIGWLRIRDLPEAFRSTVAVLEPGQASRPIKTEAGVHVLMVCDKKGQAQEIDQAAALRKRMIDEQLEIRSRRLLRDLRKSAFVDLRG